MSRRAILREKNKRAKEFIYPKKLNYHYDEVKDILTVEGKLFKGDDFRNGDIGIVTNKVIDEKQCSKCLKEFKSKAGRVKHESTCKG